MSFVARRPYRYYSKFPLTESQISEHGTWTDGHISSPRTSVQTDGSHVFGTMFSFDNVNFNDSIACLAQPNWPADQWVLAQLYNNGAVSGQEFEVVLWGTIQATNNTGIECDFVLSNGHCDLVTWDGPANTFTTRQSALGLSFSDKTYWFAQIKNGVVTVKTGTSARTDPTNPIAIIGDLATTITTYDTKTASPALTFSGGSPTIGFWNQTGVQANCPLLGFRQWWAGTFDSSGALAY